MERFPNYPLLAAQRTLTCWSPTWETCWCSLPGAWLTPVSLLCPRWPTSVSLNLDIFSPLLLKILQQGPCFIFLPPFETETANEETYEGNTETKLAFWNVLPSKNKTQKTILSLFCLCQNSCNELKPFRKQYECCSAHCLRRGKVWRMSWWKPPSSYSPGWVARWYIYTHVI